MRVPILAFIACLLVPTVVADAQWEDPAGDHEVGYTAYSQSDDATYTWTPGSQTGWYSIVDLRKVLIYEENPDTITFEVQTAADELSGQEPNSVDRVTYTFSFGFHGDARVVQILWDLRTDEGLGSLRTSADNRTRLDAAFEATRLTQTPGWKVEIPKWKFRDADKIPIRTGDLLEEIKFAATTGLWSSYSPCVNRPETPPNCWKARDDLLGGASLGNYEVSRSPAGVGHLEITTPTPLRSSNGLATTYIFELTLHNLGDKPDAALIQVGNYPTDWTISSPAYLEVPPRSKTTFPVAVSVPFSHLHGNESYVDVTATSEIDRSIKATQQIGVVWTKIPQPTGHHPDLYVHAGSGTNGWINTLKEDEEADPTAHITYNSWSARYAGSEQSHEFRFGLGLSPSLESGLDFDRGDEILVKIPVVFHYAVKPTIKATFLIVNQGTPVLEIGSTAFEANDVSAGSDVLYEFVVPVNETADRIPHREGNNLVLSFQVSYVIENDEFGIVDEIAGQQEAHEPPELLTADSYIRLPLVEYIDIVDETLLASLTKFSITALTDTYKLVNPGRTATFAIQIDNRGSGDTLEWKLVGANPEWANVYPRALNVPGDGNATVVVDVLGPELASEGENMNALLIGQSRDDPNSQVLVRLVAQVTHSQDVADETALSQKLRGIASQNDAGVPGPAAAAMLVALASATILVRRRLL